ncbi:MAG TPA: alcohol dehydrogenase [Candidatus Latescibacteria bacterium]|jgi:hydroxyacid-oxoacid transhydrogenase|nr:alcohol dehydrogenase [Candidatus Latescibacterota bacterium]
MERDTIFEMGSSNLRFGPGSTREVGMDLDDLGIKRAMVLTDPNLRDLDPVQVVLKALAKEGIETAIYDGVRVEPTDLSFKEAIVAAKEEKPDAFVAVGGGSVIDTAKAANLYYSHPDDFFAYINAPIGQGKPVPGPIKPLIAIPTTAGTGSETTGVAICDLTEMHAKTGIAHRRLKPTLGIVDPDNTRSMPPTVASATGLDVLCHALESYTAIPYDQRLKPNHPVLRPAYQGSNPISDIWALEAISMVSTYLVRAVQDPEDDEARAQMALAASMAGMGFGSAGVHLCHGMSYPVSGMVREYIPDGFVSDHAIIPHGLSVTLHAPAVFAFTAPANPARHLRAAEIMGADISDARDEDAGDILSQQIVSLMKRLEMPNGLSPLGFKADDIPTLVEGTLPQHRVTKLSPIPAEEEDLTKLFEDSMRLW